MNQSYMACVVRSPAPLHPLSASPLQGNPAYQFLRHLFRIFLGKCQANRAPRLISPLLAQIVAWDTDCHAMLSYSAWIWAVSPPRFLDSLPIAQHLR